MQKVYVIVLSLIVTTFLAKNLANASYEKPKSPIAPPETGWVVQRLQVRVTAYYGPRKGQRKYAHGSYREDVRINGAGKETRAGTVPDIGTAAADWKLLPKGTKFRIVGCSAALRSENERVSDVVFTVWDTGGAIKGKKIDVFAGFGDQGREIAENINNQKKERYLIEVVQCPPQD